MIISSLKACISLIDDFSKGLSQQQCIEQLRVTFGNEEEEEFGRGRASVSNECRPKYVVIPNNIDTAHNIIKEVSYRQTESYRRLQYNHV